MKAFSEIFDEYLRDESPEFLSRIPRTPEEKAEAMQRLKTLQKAHKKCSICLDTGFVHPLKADGKPDYSRVQPCACVRREAEQRQKERLLAYCELPEKGREMTFGNFRRSAETEKAYQACLSMAEGTFGRIFLTLMGQTNHGKTHLGVAICNYRLKQGQLAKYAYVPYLLDELRAGFKKDGDESYISRYHIFLSVPFLMLDDLGTENDTPWAQEHLDELIDYRLMHKLPTVVTSNLPWKELPFRIASRLKREGEVVPIVGPEFNPKVKR